MPATFLQKVLLTVGCLSLIHCAYSAAQHRSYLRLTEQEFTGLLPVDIIFQTLVSLLLICYSGQNVAGEFSPIRADIQMRERTFETVDNCPSFYVFEHRAKSLSPYFTTSHFDRD